MYMLQVPQAHAETEKLLAETKAMDVLEAELAAELDFGGVSTSQVGYQLGLTVPGCGRTCAELITSPEHHAPSESLVQNILRSERASSSNSTSLLRWHHAVRKQSLLAHAGS